MAPRADGTAVVRAVAKAVAQVVAAGTVVEKTAARAVTPLEPPCMYRSLTLSLKPIGGGVERAHDHNTA